MSWISIKRQKSTAMASLFMASIVMNKIVSVSVVVSHLTSC